MPTGCVKTPNSARAKETATAANSADRKGGSAGKKLVQTRLPFKLLTPVAKGSAAGTAITCTTPTSPAVAVIDLDVDEVECLTETENDREPRKRKLSYGSDESPTDTEQLRRSNSKENLAVDVATITPIKKSKIVESIDEDFGELLNDDEDDNDATANSSTKPAEKSIKPAHIQIKLPVKNKRAKRRKSLKKSDAVKETSKVAKERSDSSDDIEAIAEQLNPQKRVKVADKNKAKSEEKTENDVVSKRKLNEILVSTSDSELKLEDDTAAEISSTDVEMDVDEDDEVEKMTKNPSKETDQSNGLSASAVAAVNEKLNKLTAKQQKLMEQRRKAREEKERKLQEERNLKQQEKEQREQLKKVEREQKEEQRRKEREDKEQLRRKEREEKERKRQAEVDTKNEEKRKRNEVKEEVQRKKDEERRRKELEKEEAELKKKRAADSFTKFFVPKQPRQSTNGSLEHEQNSSDSGPSQKSSQLLAFRPFQIKDDMIMAPVIRATIESDTRKQLDSLFYVPDEDDFDDKLNDSIGRVKRPTRAQLYLGELSRGKHNPQRSKRDARLQRRAKDEEDDDDVQVVDELANAGMPILEERPKQLPWMRVKYLHFADNRRPPYYGTWRKRSQMINARRPLGQDKTHFDYEVESDCEWEEEEPGESLSASEDEKERESEEESEEEYNEWFVPHGHLSDDELQNDDEDGNTREAQKAKLQVLQQDFAQEMKKQTKKIKPRLLGPVWLDENGNKSQLFPAVFTQTIDMYGCWQLQPLTLEPPAEPASAEEPPEPITLQLDEPLLQQLVRLVHGNSNSKVFLISEYLEYLKTQIKPDSATLLPAKTALREKFDELASWKPIELTSTESKKTKKPKKRLCWVVNDEILEKFQLAELTLQNQWKYTLTPKISKADTSLREETPPVDTAEVSSAPKLEISKSTKRENTPQSPVIPPKKRATLLMSVPRDQQFHAPTKNALISQYLRKQKDDANTDKSSLAPEQTSLPSSNVNTEIVLLSD